MRIAVLDPDSTELALVQQCIERCGFECMPCSDVDALRVVLGRCDGLVADCRHASQGTATVLTIMRAATPHVPTLAMITGGNENDIIAALSAGADDYLLKPIRPSELVARLQAMLRRTYPEETGERFVFAPYAFLADRCEIVVAAGTAAERTIAMTQKEFDLALVLFRNAGRPLSRNHLRELVWGGDADVSSRTMDTHVSRLRSKLALGSSTPGASPAYRVMPVYGYGYRLDRLDASS